MIEPLSPELKALFEEEGSSHPDRNELRARVLAKVETSIALGAGVAAVVTGTQGVGAAGSGAAGSGAAGSGAAASPLASFGLVKVALLSFVAGGLIGGSTVAFVDRRMVTEKRSETPPLLRENVGARAASEPSPAPTPTAPPMAAPEIRGAEPSVPSSARPNQQRIASAPLQNREIESIWLAEAKSALLRGDPNEALTWIEKHATRYPEGALREEREVLAIQALVSSNRRDEASQRAAQFRLRFAKSSRMSAVEAALREKP